MENIPKYKTCTFLYILAFPVVLAMGIVLIPVVADYGDHALAAAAVEQTTPWFSGHLLSAVGFGLGVLSASTVIDHLKQRAHPVPAYLLPMIAVGAGLYAAGLGADGIAPLAVRAAGESPAIFFDGSGWMVSGAFMAGTAFFGIGLIFLMGHTIHAKVVTGLWRYVIMVSAFVFVAAPAIPSGWALYGVALAALGMFVPIAISIRRAA